MTVAYVPSTAADRARIALGLPICTALSVTVTDGHSDWAHAICPETGYPAAVFVEYWTMDADGEPAKVELALAATAAGARIRAILTAHSAPDEVAVEVCRWWLRFVCNDIDS